MQDHFPAWIWVPAMIIVWSVLIALWIYEAYQRRQERKAQLEQDQSHREDGDQDGFG